MLLGRHRSEVAGRVPAVNISTGNAISNKNRRKIYVTILLDVLIARTVHVEAAMADVVTAV